MDVLVTGATGFLGRHLVKELKSQGYKIHISNTKVANLEDESNLHIYDDIEFEYIFHLLNAQLEYLAETVKNMIVILKDLTNSY